MARWHSNHSVNIAIIIPTYNEVLNIAQHITAVRAIVTDAEIWIVDDSSPDGTGACVSAIAATDTRVHLYTRTAKNGLGAAYKEILGYLREHSTADAFITMDADGSHSPNALPTIIAQLSTHDVVIGSRYVTGGAIEKWNMKRKLLSWGGNVYVRIMSGISVRDVTAGFVGFRRSLLKKIDFSQMSSQGYFYQVEFKVQCAEAGASIREIPITFKDREHGESKIDRSIIQEALVCGIHLLCRRLTH